MTSPILKSLRGMRGELAPPPPAGFVPRSVSSAIDSPIASNSTQTTLVIAARVCTLCFTKRKASKMRDHCVELRLLSRRREARGLPLLTNLDESQVYLLKRLRGVIFHLSRSRKGDWIESTPGEWVTAKKAPEGQNCTTPKSAGAKCLDGVLRATRIETAERG